jgi:hypothetical protein
MSKQIFRPQKVNHYSLHSSTGKGLVSKDGFIHNVKCMFTLNIETKDKITFIIFIILQNGTINNIIYE